MLGVNIHMYMYLYMYCRTVSKLELENKRLGRENDNIRYKLTQSAKYVHAAFLNSVYRAFRFSRWFFVLKMSINCMYFVNTFTVMYYKDKP